MDQTRASQVLASVQQLSRRPSRTGVDSPDKENPLSQVLNNVSSTNTGSIAKGKKMFFFSFVFQMIVFLSKKKNIKYFVFFFFFSSSSFFVVLPLFKKIQKQKSIYWKFLIF